MAVPYGDLTPHRRSNVLARRKKCCSQWLGWAACGVHPWFVWQQQKLQRNAARGTDGKQTGTGPVWAMVCLWLSCLPRAGDFSRKQILQPRLLGLSKNPCLYLRSFNSYWIRMAEAELHRERLQAIAVSSLSSTCLFCLEKRVCVMCLRFPQGRLSIPT